MLNLKEAIHTLSCIVPYSKGLLMTETEGKRSFSSQVLQYMLGHCITENATYFPAYGGTKFNCLMTETCMHKQPAQGRYVQSPHWA